ncbi:hypothetical protein Tco_0743622 [Tanacetum coccineum]
MSSYYQPSCYGCGGPLVGSFCRQCDCERCGNIRYGGNCFHCQYDTNPNSLNFSDYPPQPRYGTNICELCGNDAHFGYDCSHQVPFVYNLDSCFNQNFDNNFSPISPSFPQQYLCCENCGGPHMTFQCQPISQDFYNSNSFSFDQYQPPQSSDIHQFPQETSKEILQARDDLMDAIQAFLKEYDHISPNEKCMALLLAEERFFKIKQAMREEQNQPKVLQELILKLMNDLQILKGIQPEKEKQAAQGFIPYWKISMIDDEEARDNFLKDVCTFLRKFSRIPFGVTPKVILIAWESFGKIKDALMDKQYQQEDIQELMSKLIEDVQNISEELSEYINCPSWNRPTIFFDDDDEYTFIYSKPKAITPDLPIEEPDNSLSMGDEHLDTIPSVENLVPIPSESKGISEDTCDVPVCENPSTFDSLNDHSEILFDSNDDDTSSDDFEDIEYVRLEEVNDVDQEEKEFDLEYILQIQDVILHEKLLNINRLIVNIESLNDNPTPDHVFKSPSSVPIPVTNSDSFFEEFDTSLSHLDNSLPEFEPFSDDTEETSSGSTTTHANNSLPEYDSFHFEIEPDQGGLTSIVMEDILGEPRVHVPNVLPTHPTLLIDSDLIIRTFLPYFTYPAISYFLFSSGNEDIIFDPDISTFYFSSLKPVAYENLIVIFLFFCFCPKDKGIRGESS